MVGECGLKCGKYENICLYEAWYSTWRIQQQENHSNSIGSVFHTPKDDC